MSLEYKFSKQNSFLIQVWIIEDGTKYIPRPVGFRANRIAEFGGMYFKNVNFNNVNLQNGAEVNIGGDLRQHSTA